MNYEINPGIWLPETGFDTAKAALADWLRLQGLQGHAARYWLSELLRLRKEDGPALVHRAVQADFCGLIDLLFPHLPKLFLRAWPQPYALHRVLSPSTCLNALCLAAMHGSVACLDTLLELGADPNGMDADQNWNTLVFHDHTGLPQTHYLVTPLDCARYFGHDDCALLLEIYGSVTMAELTGLPEAELPKPEK